MTSKIDLSKLRAKLTPAQQELLAQRLRGASAATKPQPTIPPRPPGQPVPLSVAQQRLWIVHQLAPYSSALNQPLVLHLRGPIREDLVERCLSHVVRRHQILRTRFVQQHGGTPIQEILDPAPLPVRLVDLSSLPESQRQAAARQHATEDVNRPFPDPHTGLYLRALLVRLAPEEHILGITMHHLITDGWSYGVLIRELAVLYQALAAGQPPPLPELPLQYADYAYWQQGHLTDTRIQELLTYWKHELAGAPDILDLPADHPRQPAPVFAAGKTQLALSPELTAALRRLANAENATLFMVLLAAFQVLLYRYSGQDQILVGSPTANRKQRELEGLIGFFVNTLVLRADLAGAPTFQSFLQQIRQRVLGALEHQDLLFERLVEELNPTRSVGRNPLVQAMFVLQNTPPPRVDAPGLSIAPLDIEVTSAHVDLGIEVLEGKDSLLVTLAYRADLFQPGTAAAMLQSYRVLLESAVANPAQPVTALPLLDPAARHEVLASGSQSAMDLGPSACLHTLFEAQVDRAPDQIAVVMGERCLSYGELDRRANQLAHRLRTLGARPETLVGLCADRSLELIIAILGILKTGAAYVPLDPSYPRERLAAILDDCRPSLVVVQQPLAALVEGPWTQVLVDDRHALAQQPDDRLPTTSTPQSLAYVIYTSGSTGRPKGVLIEHRAACNLVRWFAHLLHGSRCERVLQLSRFGFDASVGEIFFSLGTGKTLYMATQEELMPGPELIRVLETHAINLALMVPSALAVLPQEPLPALHTVFSGAEACPAQVVERWAPGRRFINAYGPTEATVITTAYECSPGDGSPPIGRPIANARVYVLDQELQPVPAGAAGELYIGGAGLARGYQGRPELTAERFIPDPFASEPGGRLYRTGDRVRWRPDRTLQFLGRVDQQVKLRGFRIELGDIEAALASHPAVRQAVVALRTDALDAPQASGSPSSHDQPGEPQLVAYVVPRTGDGDANLSIDTLREHVRALVPAYMVPSAYVQLAAIPVDRSGKIDRRALPRPSAEHVASAGERKPPRTPVEATVAELWSELLRVPEPGIDSDFFALGGHSLQAVRLVARLRQAFQVELPLSALFEAPTIAAVAERIERIRASAGQPERASASAGQNDRARASAGQPERASASTGQDDRARASAGQPETGLIPRASRTEPIPLSFAQEAMWRRASETGVMPGNAVIGVRMRGALDIAALQLALDDILRRHEALRSAVVTRGNDLYQEVQPFQPLALLIEDLRSAADPAHEVARLHQEEMTRPMDAGRGPLIRCRLVRTAADEHVGLVAVNRLAFDGRSTSILMGELAALYKAHRTRIPALVPELPRQYADFAVWQRSWSQSPEAARQLAYWSQRLAGAPARLALPAHASRPSAAPDSRAAAHHEITLPAALGQRIKAVCRHEGTTVSGFLLAAVQAVLAHWSQQPDFLMAVPVAGRGRIELDCLIGRFANMVLVRADVAGSPSFRELMRRVHQRALDAYAHADLPFERLRQELGRTGTALPEPVQVMFNHLEPSGASVLTVEGLALEPVGSDEPTTDIELAFQVQERLDGELRIRCTYQAARFAGDAIRDLVADVEALVNATSADPDLRAVALLPSRSGYVAPGT